MCSAKPSHAQPCLWRSGNYCIRDIKLPKIQTFSTPLTCMSCYLVYSVQPSDHMLGKGAKLLALLYAMCFLYFVTFPCCGLGHIWCLIVSISDLCRLPYLSGLVCCHLDLDARKPVFGGLRTTQVEASLRIRAD